MNKKIIFIIIGTLTLLSITFLLIPKNPNGTTENQTLEKFFELVNENKTQELFDLFHEDAIIIDDRRTFQGEENITQWLKNEIIGSKYEIKKKELIDNNHAFFTVTYDNDKINITLIGYYNLTFKDNKIINGDMNYIIQR